MSGSMGNKFVFLALYLLTAACLASCSDEPTAPRKTPHTRVWTVQPSPDSTVTLTAVWGSAANDVWAVGENGTVIHYDGTSWTAVPKLTDMDLNSVCGDADSNVYAVGDSGAALFYDGAAWSLVAGTRDVDFTGVCISVIGTAVVCDVNGLIGTPQQAGICGYAGVLLDIWSNATTPLPPDYYAVAQDGHVAHRFRTAGNPVACGNWDVCSVSLNDIWGFSDSAMVAVGYGGVIFQYDGDDWTSMASRYTETLNGVWGGSMNDLYAVGEAGSIIYYNGSAWTAMASPTGADLQAVWGVPGGVVFAVGTDGTILRLGP